MSRFWLTFVFCLGLFTFGVYAAFIDLFFSSYTPTLSAANYFMAFMHTRLPFMLPLAAFFMLHLNPPPRFFSLRFWKLPIVALAAYFAVFYEWVWYAPLIWACLFLLQLCVFSRGRVPADCAFLISYLGVYAASFLYEVPYAASASVKVAPYLLGVGLYVFMAYRFGFRLGVRGLFVLAPLLLLWGFYFTVPAVFLPLYRFAAVPAVLYVAVVVSGKRDFTQGHQPAVFTSGLVSYSPFQVVPPRRNHTRKN